MRRVAGYELDKLLGMVFRNVIAEGVHLFRVTRWQPGEDGGLLTIHGLDSGRAQLTGREFARGLMLRAWVEA